MAKKPKKDTPPPPLPPLGEIVRGGFANAEALAGPYNRWLDGQHLGPYSPRHVPISTLKFMREHPQLSLGLAAYRGPFFGIDFDVVDGTPETRAFVRKTFIDTPLMHRGLETILNALDFGFQPHEVNYDLEDVTFDPDGPDGPQPSVTMTLATVIREVNDIDPQRVTIVVDGRDRIAGYRIDGTLLETLPIEKALHAVHALEHRRWRGRSILKRAYKPWWWAEFLALYMTRWYERKSDPPYHGMAPSTPRPDPKTGLPVYPTTVLKDQLLDLRSSGAIVTPFEFDSNTKQMMWQIRELTDGGRAEPFVTGLSYLDALMLRALGVPEEIATRGSVGSQAKTDTVLGVFLQELEIVKKTLVLRSINTGIIEPLVRFNFGKSVSAPRVTAPEFNREQKGLLGELLKLILQSPLDPDLAVRLRRMLNLERIVALLNIPHHRMKEMTGLPPTAGASGQAPTALAPPPPPATDGEDDSSSG